MIRGAVVIGLVLAAASLLAFLAVGRPPGAELYLVSAYIGPFGGVDKALEEVREKSLWASWMGSVSIVIEDGKSYVVRSLSTMPCIEGGSVARYPNGTVKELGCMRLVKEGGEYVFIYRHKGREVRFRGPTVEDALWQALQSDEVLWEDKMIIDGYLVKFLFDLPSTAGAWAIPFCNGTYYGPAPRLKVVVDGVVEYRIYPENRTVKLRRAPKYIEIPLRPLGQSWFGSGARVVDACFIPGVRKEGVVAIVKRENVEIVTEILKKYTDMINVRPIQ
jgi:hypothetical protein